MVVICTNPNLSNSAMWPDMETFIDLTLEDMLVVLGFELLDDVCVLGLVSVLWLALLGDWMFPLGTARRFITFGVFEPTLLHTFLDFSWVKTALRLARLVRGYFRTVMGCALAVVLFAVGIVVDSMSVFRFVFRAVLGRLARLILARFRRIFWAFRWSFSC